jgi:hypothetical protein
MANALTKGSGEHEKNMYDRVKPLLGLTESVHVWL